MIPFKVFTRLAGFKWELLVAEFNGQVVGCGGYVGRKRMELVNLMVHPDYRRRGIGQALLEKRLQNLKLMGQPFVTTTILGSNQASLGNVGKQGFEIFDEYTVLEIPLPLPNNRTFIAAKGPSRPVRSADKPAFRQMETCTATPLWLQVEETASSSYFPVFGERLMNRFSGSQAFIRVWPSEGQPVGFLSARTGKSQTKGWLARPVIEEENLVWLPTILHETAQWLTQSGKTMMQVAVPNTRPSIQALLLETGWTTIQSWVRLVKWLDPS